MSAPENSESFIPTVREVQQMFAELLSHGDDITWDLFTQNQAEILRKKVKDFEDPKVNRISTLHWLYNPKFFDSIWKQRKFTNGQSLSALFFVMIVDNVSDPKLAEQSRSWSLYPVFRCRRCVDDNTGRNCSSQDCCMVYISQYESFEDWDKFVKSTRLPKGYMVTPFRGVYKLLDGQVELKTYYLWERNQTVVFDQISEEAKRIEGKVDLIRSANEVPSKNELDIMFKTKTNLEGAPSARQRKEDVHLEDYGSALKEYILNLESFDDLIVSMSANLEPEMLKLILKLTQTFVENTREELWQLLKYHFSTETILYQIILCILKRHSDLNIKKIEEQSSDILRRVRYYFAQACPNSRPDLLTKCTKCVGYYHIYKD
ncbi:hypothetical protein KR054_007509 [Drosophila jambulina]|nr:hypothetical protein KR054_007509 [Drosophila jambulina]